MAAEMWFCSDHHFDHDNIISFCGRPFKDSAEMNEALIVNHNSLVRPIDHCWFLGDLHMGKNASAGQRVVSLIKRMNGHKRLILGNHDHLDMRFYLEAGFDKVRSTYNHGEFIFSHIPLHPASLIRFRANVHGHIHNNQGEDFPNVMKVDRNLGFVGVQSYINVSLEVTDYKPVNLEWLRDKVNTY